MESGEKIKLVRDNSKILRVPFPPSIAQGTGGMSLQQWIALQPNGDPGIVCMIKVHEAGNERGIGFLEAWSAASGTRKTRPSCPVEP